MLVALIVAVVAAAFTLSTLSIVGIPSRPKWPWLQKLLGRLVKGRYVPQRATWAGWFLVDVVLCYSSFQSGGWYDATFVLAACYLAGATLTCLLAIKYGKGGNTAFDLICFLMTAVGGVASYFYGQNGAGIVLASGALWVSAIPNLRCAAENPEEESLPLWWLFQLAAVLSMLRVQDWAKWQSWLFPVSDAVFMFVMLGVIYGAFARKRRL